MFKNLKNVRRQGGAGGHHVKRDPWVLSKIFAARGVGGTPTPQGFYLKFLTPGTHMGSPGNSFKFLQNKRGGRGEFREFQGLSKEYESPRPVQAREKTAPHT